MVKTTNLFFQCCGNDTSLPLTYRARVIVNTGPVCPSDNASKQLRDEITQDIRDLIRDSIVLTCGTLANPAASCSALPTSSPSGYYWIRSSNGSAVQVYCDMDRVCGCNSTGGWTRVAFLNMTDPNQQCPGAWTLRTRSSEPRRLCGRGNSGARLSVSDIQHLWHELHSCVRKSDRVRG